MLDFILMFFAFTGVVVWAAIAYIIFTIWIEK